MDDIFDFIFDHLEFYISIGIAIVLILGYLSVKRSAQIYNQANETNYSTFDYFLAGDTISNFAGNGKKLNIKMRGDK